MISNNCIELDGIFLLHFMNHHLSTKNADNKFYCHNELEISLIKSGAGVYRVERKEYDIREGDIFIFNNIESHAISSIDSTSKLVNMVIMFDPRFIWSMESDLFDSRFLRIFFQRNEFFENKLDRNNTATAEVHKLLLEIEEEFINKQPEYQLMIKVKLLNILVLLIRYSGYTREDDKNSFSKRIQDLVIINRVIDYINNNIAMDMQLIDIAKVSHMNPSYFSSFFKKYMGINLWEYIAKQRVRRAIEYLNSSNKTMLEIAGLCGFNSTASFNKTFKRHTGKVPSDFR